MNNELTGVIPVPTRCHNCASGQIRKTTVNDNKGAWVCDDCDAFVTCHDGTENPVGYMAGRKTRQLRKRAHISFDKLWRSRLMTRDKAYLWLSVALKINRNDAHISWLTDAQLLKTISVSEAYLKANIETLTKRKEKNEVKKVKHNVRKREEQRRKINDRKRRNNRP